jgi:hypothetical protein
MHVYDLRLVLFFSTNFRTLGWRPNLILVFLGGLGFGLEALKWVFPCNLFNDFHSYPSTYT